MSKNRIKVGLSLGGGGVRGLAHIGVIKTLEKDFPIDMISGTSMGALIGANYALNLDVHALEKTLLEIANRKEIKEIEKLITSDSPQDEKKIILQSLVSFVKNMYLYNLRAIKRWVFSGREIFWVFDALGLNVDFSQLQIPFNCMAVDLRSGEEVILNKGNLKDAVLASVSLPGMFPPVKMGSKMLVDGGIVCSVPVDAARAMGADLVIAVFVEAQVDYSKPLGSGLDIMFQADAIRAFKLSEIKAKDADLIMYPDVGKIGWSEFSRAQECIRAGEKAAQKSKSKIEALLKKKKHERFWKNIFPFSK